MARNKKKLVCVAVEEGLVTGCFLVVDLDIAKQSVRALSGGALQAWEKKCSSGSEEDGVIQDHPLGNEHVHLRYHEVSVRVDVGCDFFL